MSQFFLQAFSEKAVIKGCREGKPRAQRMLYERFAPAMFAVSLRYMRDQMEAEDVLLKAFKKVFDHIGSFQEKGSLQNWIKKIVINEALMELRSKNKIGNEISLEEAREVQQMPSQNIEAEELMKLVQELPSGFRTVFNLYVIEGYNHKEIAKMLNISENTSKSQLSRARQILQRKINEEDKPANQDQENKPFPSIKMKQS